MIAPGRRRLDHVAHGAQIGVWHPPHQNSAPSPKATVDVPMFLLGAQLLAL